MNELCIQLPFPDRVLNPNKHISHWAKHKPRQLARQAAFYLAKETGQTLEPAQYYRFQLIFYPPDRAHRDLDNLLASMKSALDGLCQGLGINDRMIKPVPEWGPVTRPGKVEVRITELLTADG